MPARKFHEILADLIDHSPLTQREIATKLGYDKQNIVSMFKTGQAKVPINKIGPLARILEVDAVWLLRRCLQEYHPDLWAVLEDTLGPRVTAHEVEILAALREATDDMDPRLSTPSAKAKVNELTTALTT
ncbi:helix-turn-helix transcriptional regulator [Vineibacter terrae]|uniref:Helix-turn-helix transcriptional regulator n=1 Tax=Vineibacter terrae TaxID=2586908 RepID=A0A5C8PBB7_9HYPH|nr:helix-turn-helix transcriptional regulator [Vineibacter terrae]TXL70848.1 helix-turn-helix transcriptional regulator [Vineibacter terrae]